MSIATPGRVRQSPTGTWLGESVVAVELDADKDGEVDNLEGLKITVASLEFTTGQAYALLNDDDTDGDGIPDFADGYDRKSNTDNDNRVVGERFTPVELQWSNDSPLISLSRIRFIYSAGDLYNSGDTIPTHYNKSGDFRIWTKDGDDLINGTRTKDDYLDSYRWYTPDEVGFDSEGKAKLYIEGLKISPSDNPILPLPDLSEEETNYYEDNLAKLKIDFTNLPTEGIVYLNVVENPDCIKLWASPGKGDASAKLGTYNTFELSDPDQRAQLQSYIQDGVYIEGMAPSATERDVKIELKYELSGNVIAEDCVRATVVMINLGNAVYREGQIEAYSARCHTGLVTIYHGDMERDSIRNPELYGITQLPGWVYPWQELYGMDHDEDYLKDTERGFINNAQGCEYWYCYTNLSDVSNDSNGYRHRLKILGTAKWFRDNWTQNYDAFQCMTPTSSPWNGALNTVQGMRCDGLVEVCYEFNNIMVWGKIVGGPGPHYDIHVQAYLEDEHNDWEGGNPEDDIKVFKTFLPVTQGGFADVFVSEHYAPSAHPTYRDVFWATTFSEQRLTLPETISPETHNH